MNLSSFVAESEALGLDLHGVTVVHGGQTVATHFWPPYRPEARHVLYSLSKTFTALGVLFAVQEGLVALDDPVVKSFPRLAPRTLPQFWDEVKVRHLLTMSLGFDADPTYDITAQADWVKALLGRPLDHPPGTRFVYNNMATYLASSVVQQATAMTLRDWLVPRLFEPLGIADPVWDSCPRGRTCGGWGLYLTLEEVGRLGRLLLGRGAWEGRQLLDAALVDEAVRNHIATGDNPRHDSHQGYGFQIWRCRHGAFRADGAFGQLCVVRPDLDLVVAVQAGVADAQPLLDLVWKHLTPGEEPLVLPEPGQVASGGRRPPALVGPVTGALGRFGSWAGRSWDLVCHPGAWTQVGFGGSPEEPTFWYRDQRGRHEVPFGWGQWAESRNRFWRHVSQTRRLYTNLVSGRWTGEETLTLTARFPEEAPVVTLTLERRGEVLALAQHLSVSLRPLDFDGIEGTPCKP